VEPLVSIVIPTYNLDRVKDVRRANRGLATQGRRGPATRRRATTLVN